MFIKEVRLKNFRNFDELELFPADGVNILYGANAAGKTNILEAIYTVCAGKSLKNARERELIRIGEDEAHIMALVDKSSVSCRIDTHLRKGRTRGIAINSVPIRRISELIGIANIVSFSPEDLHIVKSGPSERRRFMDLALCQLERLYVHDLIRYNRVINQKNKLLKSFRPDTDFLNVYDEQLVEYGTGIIKARRRYIEELSGALSLIYARIAGEGERLSLVYEGDTTEETFTEDLIRRRESEMKNMISLTGPHRDDLSFFLDDRDLRRFGSQGQQRSAVIALKLAEIEIVRRRTGERPALLLDDVLSELDRRRQETLLGALGDIQTFISCTGLDELVEHRFHMDKVFHVKEGKIEANDI